MIKNCLLVIGIGWCGCDMGPGGNTPYKADISWYNRTWSNATVYNTHYHGSRDIGWIDFVDATKRTNRIYGPVLIERIRPIKILQAEKE